MATAFTASTPTVSTARNSPKRTQLRIPRIPAHKSQSPGQTIQEQAFGALLGGLVGCSLALTAPEVLSPVAKAGVIIEQPERKRIFNGPSEEKKPKQAAEEKKKSSGGEGFSVPSFGSAGTLALPLAIVGISGTALAARQLDGGFDEFLQGTLIKDSINEGVGYEVALKSGEPLKAAAGGRKKK